MSKYIYFNEKKVLNYLVNFGHVYTVRKYERKNYISRVKVGSKFPGYEVIVNTMGILSDDLLSKYVNESGFNTVDEWKEAIERQHKEEVNLWVLKAQMIKGINHKQVTL